MKRLEAELYTIGHSNHPIERFLGLLRDNGMKTVADVRSRPYSRFVPHFSKKKLERILAEQGMGYLFFGQELGGKPPRGGIERWPADYHGRIIDPGFLGGIKRLLDAAGAGRTALLCRERDPLDCHRLYLVCRYLRGMVGPIRHILPDGSFEEQAATERRLIDRTGSSPELPLFEKASSDQDRDTLDLAYDRWWQAKGP